MGTHSGGTAAVQICLDKTVSPVINIWSKVCSTYTWGASWDILHDKKISVTWTLEHGHGVVHTIGERHGHLEQTTLPNGLLLAGDAAFPDLQIENTLGVLLGSRIEPKGMVFPPLLPRRVMGWLAKPLQAGSRNVQDGVGGESELTSPPASDFDKVP